MSKSPEKWIAALVALVLSGAGLGIFLVMRPPQTAQSAAPVSTQASTADEPLTVSGRLMAGGDTVCVAPPSSPAGSGRILKLMVKDGEAVKQTQVLAVMDTYDRLLAAAIQAQAQLREAQMRVDQVRAGTVNLAEISAQQEQAASKRALIEAKQAEVIDRAADLKRAEDEFKRFMQLFDEGAVSEAQMTDRKIAHQAAASALERSVAARDQLVRDFNQAQQANTLATQVRPIDVQQAEAQAQVADANLQRAKADLETAAVRSPIAGKVIKLAAKEGEQVNGTVISSNGISECRGVAEVSKLDQLFAVAEVTPADVAKLRQGQRAIVTSAAFPGQLLGTVEQISPKSNLPSNNALNASAATTPSSAVEVKIRLNSGKPIANSTATVTVALLP